jgi:hypothetical protein
MEDRSAGRKASHTRKLKKKQTELGPTTRQVISHKGTEQKAGGVNLPSRFEKAISQIQGLNDLLLSEDLDPRILTDFRDALNRLRTAAWAAQQYVARKETDEGSGSVLSLVAGERIRNIYQLCQAVSKDLKRSDIEIQAGSLVQLYEVMRALTEQLKEVVNRLG